MDNVTVTMPYKEFEEMKKKADRLVALERKEKIIVYLDESKVSPYHDNTMRVEVSLRDLEKR